MTTVFDVAKYILSKTGAITAMKLQKLVYYSQAWSLVWDEEPLFSETIEAWKNGPVCAALYQEHKGLYNVKERQITSGVIDNLTSDQIETIDIVLKNYGSKSSQWLSDKTHMEEPWKLARKGVAEDGEWSNETILLSDMAEYYSSLS